MSASAPPSAPRFDTVLIANRGAIACRIIRTLHAMGLKAVAVYSEADADARHVALADASVCIGPAPAAQSYLNAERILAAARDTGAGAIHPGYGFLSENPGFAQACEDAGIAFIGPTPDQMRAFGLKHTARTLAQQHGVPLLPGSELLDDAAHARSEAERIGYPVMLKSTAGGGGIGMRLVRDAAELDAAWEAVERLARANFKDAGLFLEKFVERARHIEVQLFGDGRGHVVALGERDCSAQRRNQKVVEETPAPGLADDTRSALLAAAVRLGQAVSYRSAGTVEFVLDADTGAFYFLEVNTRLQVEHGVTEQVTGVDLVEWMVKLARGDVWPLQAPTPRGASIQVRLYAEDPARGFQPSAGVLTEVAFPEGVRVDGWVDAGTEVPSHYDPMLAKLIVTADTRDEAVARLQQALAATRLSGIETNLRYLRALTAAPVFVDGRVVTRSLGEFAWRPRALEVLDGGVQTTVQDWPGRIGYWDIGVPPSGPMDDLHLRLANRLVGNPEGAPALECTLGGPSLKAHADLVVALAGAPMPVKLDGQPLSFDEAFHRPLHLRAGSVLKLGTVAADEGGARTYLAVSGGLDVPDYLGSASTFTLGQFGGHAGRTLRTADMLAISQPELPACTTPAPVAPPQAAHPSLIPSYGSTWNIGVLYGPHGAPDFFTAEAIEEFFAAEWEVHYNSNRLGVRLSGPKPSWARADGGEAGLHPSNVHDCEYAIGSINFTGDFPVILTKDGPSLGGFVCPVTIAKAELWKVGQVKPGDKLRFHPIGFQQAQSLEQAQLGSIEALAAISAVTLPAPSLQADTTVSATVLAELPAEGSRPRAVYRQAGDAYILLEYGHNVLDLALRLRVHLLMEALKAEPLRGLEELAPGVRSLQLRYDSRVLHQRTLLEHLLRLEENLGDVANLKVPTRIVHLPMAFEDSATLAAVERYRETVRSEAPWLPNNVDFIQRANGLASREQVRDILFDASYLILGLGDVYLDAPCAVPLDPRHRLLSSKYNPARTFTAEGTVGIGGMYMCIYGMDSPGGYQLVGRTLPIWNKYVKNAQFENGQPWLLRFFDQVRFYPVSEAELDEFREAFREGRAQIRIEQTEFDFAAYNRFIADNAADIAAFQHQQKAAFDAEVELWKDDDPSAAQALTSTTPDDADLDGHMVAAEMSGSVWKVLVEPGQHVEAGTPLLVVEAMKMELAVTAPVAGTVKSLRCAPGKAVTPGDALLLLTPSEAA